MHRNAVTKKGVQYERRLLALCQRHIMAGSNWRIGWFPAIPRSRTPLCDILAGSIGPTVVLLRVIQKPKRPCYTLDIPALNPRTIFNLHTISSNYDHRCNRSRYGLRVFELQRNPYIGDIVVSLIPCHHTE